MTEPAPGLATATATTVAALAASDFGCRPTGPETLTPRLRPLGRVLREADRRLSQTPELAADAPGAVEWVLDNWYVIDQALRQLDAGLPARYLRELPRVTTGAAAGLPRAYRLARLLVDEAEDFLDITAAAGGVEQYQQQTVLTIGELWALPNFIRLAVLEDLAACAAPLAGLTAEQWGGEPGALGTAPSETRIAGCITSLRQIAAHDWKTFFERLSSVDAVLRRDPAAAYARGDFATRDRYRKVVEEVARWTETDETAVAATALALCEACPRSDRRSHVGYYLVDRGRPELEARLGCLIPPRVRWRRRVETHATAVYLTGVALATTLLLLVLGAALAATHGSMAQLGLLLAVAVIPALGIAVPLVNWIITHTLPPRLLVRLDFEDGIPATYRTVVAVPTLLTSRDDVHAMLRQIEVNYQGNADAALRFALLTDEPDAAEQHTPADDGLLAAAADGIRSLNERYGEPGQQPFLLLWRSRRWNPGEGRWMGWERKRGKLVELNRLLLGDTATGLEVRAGAAEALENVRFVITLDADTVLPQRAAARLVGTLAHPLNAAEFDTAGRVVAGYTVLQPRIDVAVRSAGATPFARLFEGETGLDLYTHAVSEAYHDLFAEGIYAGKGIYEVAAFERSLEGRVPENALLSHDLFEGIHGRAGFVSDVQLFEDYPSHVVGHARRLHRWVRGDWQLLPWLMPRVPGAGGARLPTRLSVISRWKIVDNLRRSLAAPSLMTLLFVGWLALPGAPWLWTVIAVGTLAPPIILGAATSANRLVAGAPWRPAVAQATWKIGVDALRWAMTLLFLPFEAVVTTDAVVRAVVRVYGTRRHLLEWESAALTARAMARRRGAGFTWWKMAASPVIAVVGGGAVLAAGGPAVGVALPFLLGWLVAPQVAYRMSQIRTRPVAPLDPWDHDRLRRLARRTWHYFERVLGPDNLWLAPDHLQEASVDAVVHRTSPTNIGMGLLAALGAYDLGYLGLRSAVTTLHHIVDNLGRLERFRGHFYNWCDTRTGAVLLPRYVSTVDSGNLAAALITIEQGCYDLAAAPLIAPALWAGVDDTVAVLREEVAAIGGAAPPADALEQLLGDLAETLAREPVGTTDGRLLIAAVCGVQIPAIERALAARVAAVGGSVTAGLRLRDLRTWFDRVRHQADCVALEFEALAPWAAVAADPPAVVSHPATAGAVRDAWATLAARLDQVPALDAIGQFRAEVAALLADLMAVAERELRDAGERRAIRTWQERLTAALAAAAESAAHTTAELRAIASAAGRLVEEMDFTFLYDRQRRLFHIGYEVDAAQLDGSYYDLLASEARLASLVAIAKRDVAERHWLHLGRPFGRVGGDRVLLSWSGSMFEYLMPALLTELPDDALLTAACRAAVRQQARFAGRYAIPWGISESAFHQLTAEGDYQYRAFGVPGLGLKRELGDRLVVAPYASVLGLSLAPRDVADNLRRLQALGMVGTYGLYEALDFGKPGFGVAGAPAIVRAYMSHHQGMILVALANHLAGRGMVRRFHSDPRVASVEYLLYEQVPRHVSTQRPALRRVRTPPLRRMRYEGWSVEPLAAVPSLHVLSNGRYGVLLTGAGGGGSRWRQRALTRWRAEAGVDQWGHWAYLQDRDSGALWSIGRQPVWDAPAETVARFTPEAAEYRARAHGIAARAVVTVPPGDDLEIRRVTLTNETARPRRVAVTSFFEVALARPADDLRHQAFAKLSVASEILPSRTLLFRRRSGGADSQPLCLGHTVVMPVDATVDCSFATDRARFLGPGGTARRPAALLSGERLDGAAGLTYDPAAAIRCAVDLEPRGEVTLAFVTGVGTAPAHVLSRLDAYRSWSRIERSFEEAAVHAEAELGALGMEAAEAPAAQQLFSALMTPDPRLRPPPEVLTASRPPQPGLWRFGISGDRPLLVVRAGDGPGDNLGVVRTALRAHAQLRRRGCEIDLVVLDLVSTGYQQPLFDRLRVLVAEAGSEKWLDRSGGVFVVRAHELDESDARLIETAARAVLDTGRGSLEQQVEALRRPPARLPAFTAVRDPAIPEPAVEIATAEQLLYDNGLGGFSADGREYVLRLDDTRRPPRAWIHVVANPTFGFTISATGGGFTWAVNSGERRLTPWRNDPVSDLPGEALYLRDEETGKVWSPTPAPAGTSGPYEVRFGAGYAVFRHGAHGIAQTLRLFTPLDDPVKVVELTVENRSDRLRRLTATYYAEWVLGTSRHRTAPHLVPEYDAAAHVLLVRNPFHAPFNERVAFLAAADPPHDLTTDRIDFVGEAGDLARPAGLHRLGPGGKVKPGGDCCGALQVYLQLEPGERRTVRFFLGDAPDRAAAVRLAARYRDPGTAPAAWEAVRRHWDQLLGAVQVRTPDPAADILLNRWLLYQATACRLWGRSALSQSSGAFGFRDQLQDVLALAVARPDVTRAHLCAAAARQFEDGDVLHWWHPGLEEGVRTRCSDDLLWLPYAAAHYWTVTADDSLFDEPIPFLEGDPLAPEETDRFGRFATGPQPASFYEHCLRALHHASRFGEHGLPLFGSGDWNDGMNRVGARGRGESVWLGWFLAATLRAFAPVCERRGDIERAHDLRRRADDVVAAIERHAWDGAWYRRGYFDDGTPLGSAQSDECRIDAVAQSWAVISRLADSDRAAAAMASVFRILADSELQLVRLFDPPFDRTLHDPGYIKAYPPGVRENGSQYTHAALWTAWATGLQGDGDRLGELVHWLNPIHRTATPGGVARYRGEPYAVAADVATAAATPGMAGWTWYTGSAAWMYRLGIEVLLGLRREHDRLRIDPCVPRAWTEFAAVWRHQAAEYRIRVRNPDGVCRGVASLTVDGEAVTGSGVPLRGEPGVHVVEVILGGSPAGTEVVAQGSRGSAR